MKTVNGLVVSYLDLADTHKFSRGIVPLRDKTCQEIGNLLKVDPSQDKTFKEIGNILEGDDLKVLRDFLFFLSKYGALEQSENIGNQFEEEKEIKILEVNHLEVIEKLKFLKATPVFEGTIDDVYLDLPGNILENKDYKVSFRIRHKMSKDGHFGLYYTIKRKKPADLSLKIPTRICYEKEFEIKSPGMVIDGLELIDLKPYRRKIKRRIAYILDGVKFDIDLYQQIDGYKKIPALLEIETDNLDLLPGIILMLGLQNNKISSSGSRGMQEKIYGIPNDAHLIKDPESGLVLPKKVLDEHKKRFEANCKTLKN